MPFNTPGQIADFDAQGIILSGGPATITAADTRAPAVVFDSGVPVLGICYGQMAMVEYLGGVVESAEHHEFGRAFVEVTGDSRVFDGIWKVGSREQGMSHGDRVIAHPMAFGGRHRRPRPSPRLSMRCVGIMALCSIEVVHTPAATNCCAVSCATSPLRCIGRWPPARDGSRRDPRPGRRQPGDLRPLRRRRQLVAAVLIHEAIGDQLTCVFVDHGLLRQGEAEEVVRLFGGHYNIPLIHHNAGELFLSRLDGVDDRRPAQNHRATDDVFEAEARKIDGARFAQAALSV